MRSIRTEVDITAPPERVWAVLTDFPKYEEWNPLIVKASGDATLRDRLAIELSSGERSTISFKPTVTESKEDHVLEWLGSFGVRGIFDGRHRFELAETREGTKLVHSEEFTGVLATLVHRLTGHLTQANFEAMNASLKARVESGA